MATSSTDAPWPARYSLWLIQVIWLTTPHCTKYKQSIACIRVVSQVLLQRLLELFIEKTLSCSYYRWLYCKALHAHAYDFLEMSLSNLYVILYVRKSSFGYNVYNFISESTKFTKQFEFQFLDFFLNFSKFQVKNFLGNFNRIWWGIILFQLEKIGLQNRASKTKRENT